MFKNIIEWDHPDNNNSYIFIRKTKYIFFGICALFSSIVIVYIFIIHNIWWQEILDQWPRIWMPRIVFYGINISMMFFLYFIIFLLVNYFYTVLIITEQKITEIRFNLNFKEKVKHIDMYRILSSSANITWMIQTVCNFGKVILRNTNDEDIIYHNIPRPKKVARIIEKYREKNTEERLSNIVT